MSAQSPRYAYVITLGLGILAFFVSTKMTSVELSLLKSILINSAIYLFFGILVGLLWPMGSWRLAVWLSIPIVFLMMLSPLFAGYVDVFLRKDLPVLITIGTTACLGGTIGSRLRSLGQKTTE